MVSEAMHNSANDATRSTLPFIFISLKVTFAPDAMNDDDDYVCMCGEDGDRDRRNVSLLLTFPLFFFSRREAEVWVCGCMTSGLSSFVDRVRQTPLKKTRTFSCVRGELVSVVFEHLHDGYCDARVAGARHRAQLCATQNMEEMEETRCTFSQHARSL